MIMTPPPAFAFYQGFLTSKELANLRQVNRQLRRDLEDVHRFTITEEARTRTEKYMENLKAMKNLTPSLYAKLSRRVNGIYQKRPYINIVDVSDAVSDAFIHFLYEITDGDDPTTVSDQAVLRQTLYPLLLFMLQAGRFRLYICTPLLPLPSNQYDTDLMMKMLPLIHDGFEGQDRCSLCTEAGECPAMTALFQLEDRYDRLSWVVSPFEQEPDTKRVFKIVRRGVKSYL